MRGHAVPVVAAALSAGWLLAQASGRPLVSAVVAVTAIATGCGLAERRGHRLRGWLLAIALALTAALGTLLLAPPGGAGALLVMLALLVTGGALMPLLYAATFEDGDDAP